MGIPRKHRQPDLPILYHTLLDTTYFFSFDAFHNFINARATTILVRFYSSGQADPTWPFFYTGGVTSSWFQPTLAQRVRPFFFFIPLLLRSRLWKGRFMMAVVLGCTNRIYKCLTILTNTSRMYAI